MTTPSEQELTCKELVEIITDYFEDSLSPADRRRFDEHLATCPFCRIYVEQMRATVRALGHIPEEAVSPDALEALREHFRRWR
jgi:anti-sigma factor RsiW